MLNNEGRDGALKRRPGGPKLSAINPSASRQTVRLSAVADAKIEGEAAGAERELGLAVRKFLTACESGQLYERLAHKPSSGDLVPFFELYSEAVFAAQARERLMLVHAQERREIKRYIKLLPKVADRVLAIIRGKDGVWWRVVEQSCRHVDLGEWPSPYGRYGATDFHHRNPDISRLRGALEIHVKEWEKKAWDALVVANEGNKHGPRVPAAKQRLFPKRADWLSKELGARGWDKYELAAESTAEHRSIQKILDGYKVNESVIGKVVTGLSTKQHPKVNRLSVPND